MSRDKAAIYDIIQAAEDILYLMQQVSFAELAMNREKKSADTFTLWRSLAVIILMSDILV